MVCMHACMQYVATSSDQYVNMSRTELAGTLASESVGNIDCSSNNLAGWLAGWLASICIRRQIYHPKDLQEEDAR